MSLGTLVEVDNLEVHFKRGGSLLSDLFRQSEVIHAVDGINLRINRGETFGLVGESGCGKTTTGRAILRLVPKTGGNVSYKNEEVFEFNKKKLYAFRRKAQMIFQDPISSLNPRMKAGDIIAEPLRIHGHEQNEGELDARVDELLEEVGLLRDDKMKYPHEFSGGQAQRIGVARALAVHPEFLVCDEPTSGMDVSIMAKIINFMKMIKERHQLTYLWISHNLEVVKYLCDKVAIMYLGKIVEQGNAIDIFKHPLHPYTQALLSVVPFIHEETAEPILLQGEVPSTVELPKGCRFASRCWKKDKECEEIAPALVTIEENHYVACLKVTSAF